MATENKPQKKSDESQPFIPPANSKPNTPASTEGQSDAYQEKGYRLAKKQYWVAIITMILLFVYTAIASYQACMMRTTIQIDIDAQSPLVYVFEISLNNRMPDRPPSHAIPEKDKIHLLNNAASEINRYIAVEFENFGNRASLVEKMDIEWKVAKTLSPKPEYSHLREYSGAIRPSGVPPNSRSRC